MGRASGRGTARVRRALVLALAVVLAVVAQLSGPAQHASATGTLVATPTTTVRASPSSTTSLSGMSISGDTSDTLQATLATTSGTISFSPTPSNVTLAYNNSWTGTSSVTFSGLQSAINTALLNASIVTGSSTGTASVSLTAMLLSTGYNYLSSNQHFYQYVASSGVSWTSADTAAKALSYAGQPGYLATIPSSSVNTFISSRIASATNVWFGARDYESTATDNTQQYATVTGSPSVTYPRVWRWTEGNDESPIAGQVIVACTALTGYSSCTAPNGVYTSWASGSEPNNANGTSTAYSGEWVGVTNWSGTSGAWNDLGASNTGASGYVVEYGGKTNSDPSLGTGFSGVVTSSTTVSIANAAVAPSAPTITAVAGNASATVSWNPPADGGSPITSYQYAVGGGTWTTVTPTVTSAVVNGNTVVTDTATVSGLTNGTAASIQVRAVNSVNPGAASTAAVVTPVTVPDAPTAVVATRGNTSASVAFVAPGFNGGSVVTGYVATATPGGATGSCTSTPCSVTGLTNGTAYSFTVHATNAVGNSAESAASAAVTPATVPGVPTGITATPADSSASVAFTAPAGNGATITSYLVTAAPGGATASCSSSPCVVTGLTNGTAYTFTVRATNAVGNGSTSSASSAVTPVTVPGAPTAVVATRGNASASVAFSAPSLTGGLLITSYTATASPGGATASCSTSPCAVTGLTNGTAYTFTVHATNSAGDGMESAASSAATPATVPGVPTAVVATRGNTTASVAFTAPASNGSAITGYTVTTQPGGATTSCSSSPCTVTGLTNGSAYTFTVLATNAVGAGGASASSAGVTPATVPGAPTTVVATRGDTSASVAFVAPASTGGSAVTGYTATASPGGATATCSTSPCTVTGLTNGTAYTFTVHATNAVGDSVESAASSLVTPATVPGTPTGLTPTPTDSAVSVAFTAPAEHGAAITSYLVTASPGGATATCSTSPCTVTGLTNGTAYTFTVRATNAVGDGGTSSSSAAAVPAAVPGVPSGITATPADSSASVAFTAPSGNGSAITGYLVTAAPGGATASCSSSPCVVSGLTNGTAYTFTVWAINAVGNGSTSSASSAVTPSTVPGVPTGVVATRNNASASVAFTAPGSNGGLSITSYTATASPGGASASCTSSPCAVTGLTNGTAYTFTVHATNATGAGTESAASSAVTPATVPGVPTAVVATRSNASASVAFAAPSANGSAITGYTVTTQPGGATTSCSASPCTVTGLTNGTAYTFTVLATNAVGDSSASAASAGVTPATLPGAPTTVVATRGDTTASVAFVSPASTGGSTVTGYTATASPGGATATCSSSPCAVTGLTNGTAYTFTVHATNALGDSVESAASSLVTPASTPGTPTGLLVTPADSAVSVTFTAPADHGAAITSYLVTASPGGATATCSMSPCAVTGLTNGTAYTFTVRATNAVGDGGTSSSSATAVPVTVPGAPTSVVATRGDSSASVAFAAPTGTGGTVITSYTATASPGGASATCVTSPCVVAGLINGTTYTFTIAATNAVSVGPSSSPSAGVVPAGMPGVPTAVVATRGDASATIAFATAAANGSAISGYVVTASPGGSVTNCSAAPCTVGALTNGTAYVFTVRAVNAVGTGGASTASTPVVPATVPGTPTALTAARGDGQATADFSAPVSNGGSAITGYRLTASPGGATVACPAAPCTVTGLTNGVTYSLTVHALNAVGDGADASWPAVTPAAAPGRPTGVRADAQDGAVAVSWTAPADTGGEPITGYRVAVSPGGMSQSCVASPCTVSGLVNGREVTVRVIASNVVGDSPPSPASAAATPAGVPATPSGFTATVIDGAVQLEFDPPSDNGAAITGYEVSVDQGTSWRPAASSGTVRVRITVDGLQNGVPVDIQVRAVNAAGAGGGAGPGSMRPVALPAAPTMAAALGGDGIASISWTPPSSTGGVPLTGYIVTATPGGRTCSTGGATGCIVRGLTNGVRYSFTVHAVTGVGSSVESDAVSATPVAVPGAPTGVTASGRAAAAVVTFTAPADTGGAAITGYVVRSAGTPDQRCAASPCRIDGLQNGTAYRFRVAAVNRVGTGPAAAGATVVPADRPAAPTGLTMSADDGSVDITFRAPDDRGSDITGYLVSTDGGTTWAPLDVSPDGTLHATLAGLPNGVPIGVAVRAVNAVGTGSPAATVWATPASTPAAPIGVRVTPGDGSATVQFGPPKDGGSTVASYVVVVSPGGRHVTCTASPCTIDGLRNGDRYAFKVFAKNAAGTGAAVRTPRSVVPRAVPVAVAPPTVRLVRTSVEVSWDAPPSIPNATVTGYTVKAWPGGATCTPEPATATHCSMTGLTPGRVYAFTVSVSATGGHSAVSPQSRPVVLASFVEADAPPSLLTSPMFWAVVVAAALIALFLLLAWRRRRRDRDA